MLTSIRTGVRIVPFWDRLPRFFLFPLAMSNLAVLVALSLGSLLAVVLPVPSPFDLLLVEAIIWLTAFRHAFRAMEITAQGYVDADAQGQAPESDPARVNLPWKLVAIFFCWGAAIGVFDAVSPSLGFLVSLAFAVATPAIIMQLCASNDLGESLDPRRWWHFIVHIGKPYALLCLFLLLLSNGAPIALTLLTPLLGGALALPIVNLVLLFFNLIMFHMMGYVMYQYHDALGLAVFVEPDGAGAEDEAAPRGPDARIAEHLAAGQVAEAVALAEAAVRERPDDVAAHERVRRLLSATGDQDKALAHAERFLSVLLKAGRFHQAVQTYQMLQSAGRAVDVPPAHTLALAQAAEKAQQPMLAVELVRAFDKRFPGHPDIPGVYLFSARLASERMRQDDLARAILQALISRYPDHPLTVEATRYLEVMRRLAAGPVSG